MARRGGLGTNLDALIPTSLTVAGQEVATQNEIDVNLISANPRQPRQHFDVDALNELTASIKEIGILQPPVVRQKPDGSYELIMGERRFRAANFSISPESLKPKSARACPALSAPVISFC